MKRAGKIEGGRGLTMRPTDWAVVVSLIVALGGAVEVVAGWVSSNGEWIQQGAGIVAGGLAVGGLSAIFSNLSG